MKKSAIILTILAFALTSALPTQAQPSAKNTIFFEGGGNGFLYTINYDRMVSDTWSARVGLMSHPAITVVPIMANKLKGAGNSKLELGAGVMLIELSPILDFVALINDDHLGPVGVTTTIGYRYQRPDSGINFRIGLTPFLAPDFGVSAGLSLGYTL